MKKIIVLGILAMIVVLTIPITSAQPQSEFWLIPDNSSADYGETTEVGIWVNTTVPATGGILDITYTCCCGNITDYTANTTAFQDQAVTLMACGHLIVIYTRLPVPSNAPAGVYHLGNFTVHCCGETYCETDLTFDVGTSINHWNATAGAVEVIPHTTDNGTFTCGEPTEETFTKDLYEGWNLVSLPLTPSDNSASSVLASVWENVTTPVYRYNATSKQFESASTMDPGEGYFVHIKQNCTWTYSGTSAYTSMSTELKQGLNMVGWLNCTKSISDTNLSSSSLDYYVARFDATTQKFKVFNPVAPLVFNDFDAVERGEGYFVSAKADTTLIESC